MWSKGEFSIDGEPLWGPFGHLHCLTDGLGFGTVLGPVIVAIAIDKVLRGTWRDSPPRDPQP